MRITIVTTLCLVLLAPAVALARSPAGGIQECRRLEFQLAHYKVMTNRTGQLNNSLWKQRFKDHLETLRAFERMTREDRDAAVDDLIELLGVWDGLLRKQTGHDVQNLATYLGGPFTDEQRQEIYRSVLRAKRYTFIESGVTHPNFLELLTEVTTAQQQDRVQKALGSLLHEPRVR